MALLIHIALHVPPLVLLLLESVDDPVDTGRGLLPQHFHVLRQLLAEHSLQRLRHQNPRRRTQLIVQSECVYPLFGLVHSWSLFFGK